MAEYEAPSSPVPDSYSPTNSTARLDGGSTEKINLKNTMYYLYVIAFAEVMVFAQGASLLNNLGKAGADTEYGGYCKYAIALGVIGMLIAASMGALILTDSMNEDINKVLSGVLFAWNGVGVGITTFGDPFLNIGLTPNGYFGVWVALFGSAVLLGQTVAPAKINAKSEQARLVIRQTLDKFQETTMLVVLVVTSIITLIVAAIQCEKSVDCGKIRGFAIAFAVFNCMTSGAFFLLNKISKPFYITLNIWIFVGNAIWWAIGFFFITLTVNDFSGLSNGYLAVLFGTICAINLPSVKQRHSEEHSEVASV